jgi:hypothetical protein
MRSARQSWPSDRMAERGSADHRPFQEGRRAELGPRPQLLVGGRFWKLQLSGLKPVGPGRHRVQPRSQRQGVHASHQWRYIDCLVIETPSKLYCLSICAAEAINCHNYDGVTVCNLGNTFSEEERNSRWKSWGGKLMRTCFTQIIIYHS